MVRMGERKQQKEQDSKRALGVRTNLAGQAGGPKVQAHCVGSAVPGPNVACAGLLGSTKMGLKKMDPRPKNKIKIKLQ